MTAPIVPATLVVVDMLQDFFREGPLAAQRERLVASTNELVDEFRSRKLPIIWIRQEFRADLADAYLEMRRRSIQMVIADTEGSRLLPELRFDPSDTVVVKKRYSAFFGTELERLIQTTVPGVLVIAGVNTHACVRMTVIDAYQRDLDVVVADDCVASYDTEHHDITKRYLDGKMAAFLSNAMIVGRLNQA